MLRTVVAPAHLVALTMRELPLDGVRVPPLLIEQSACCGPEPVRGVLFLRVATGPQRNVQRVFTHGTGSVAVGGENVARGFSARDVVEARVGIEPA